MANIFSKIWQATPFSGDVKPTIAHLRLTGVIGGDGRMSKNLNMPRLEKAIKEAFEMDDIKAVAISINSPGGSPVQSRLIHDRIRAFADEKHLPVYTFAEDVAASGGYILAMTGDEIYGDESSIIGSIGVISAQFGFVEAMEKLGVDRRVYTSGKSKSQLDPFKPENPEDIARFNEMLNDTHDIFKNLVRARRKDKLTGDEDVMFSGQFWLTGKAAEMGLVDGIGEMRSMMRDRFGEDVVIKNVEIDSKSFIQKMLSNKMDITSIIDAEALVDTMETKAMWQQYKR